MPPQAAKSLTANIAEADFASEVLESAQPVLVEFWTPWSRPCQVLESILQEIANAWVGKARIVKVNADDSLDLSLWYGIQSIPTLIYFVAGKPCLRIVGTASKEAILDKLRPFSAPREPTLPAATAMGSGGSLRGRSDEMFTESTAIPTLPLYSAKRNLHHVVFFCHAPQARQVSIIGDFNRWDPNATPMTKQPDGRWLVCLELSHGYHQYLFLVDGQRVLDANAAGRARNARNEQVCLRAIS